MASDGVEGERRALFAHRTDVSERHEAELNERLEPVADAEYQAVAVLQQVAHRLGDRRCAEERRDELGGAVGLVATTETAGDEHDVRLADGTHERLGALGDRCRREVVHDEHLRLGPRAAESPRRVELAVVAGKHGDDHFGFRSKNCRSRYDLSRVVRDSLDRFAGLAIGEDGFELAFPRLLQFGEVDRVAACNQRVRFGRDADESHVHVVGASRNLGIVG